MARFRAAFVAPLAILIGTSVAAQTTGQTTTSNEPTPFSGDWVAVGVGAAVIPTYNGSDDYHVIPAGTFIGNVGGHDFMLQGLQLSVDALRNSKTGPNISLGPVVGLALDRTRRVRNNPQVAALGKLDVAVELGAYASVEIGKGILNPYDSASISVTGTHDVASAHGSYTITPSISYRTPLSRHTLAGLNFSGDIVGDGFADYYYTVTPAQSTLSTLRPYHAKGGWMNFNTSLFVSHTFRDDFRGWTLFGGVNYTRLRGSIADSPIVRDVGSRDQWFGALGIGYIFQ